MVKEKKDIAERIRKLQALQRSPYEAEAKSARLKVEELLLKSGTTLDELGLASSFATDITTAQNKNSGPWQERLLHSLTRNTEIRVYCSRSESSNLYSLEGMESSVQTILSLYQNLENRILGLSRDFEPCISDLESFRHGIVESLEIKLQQLLQSLHRSIPTQEISKTPIEKQLNNMDQEEEWDEWYGREENSYYLGKAIGRKISVNFVLDRGIRSS